MVIRFFRCAILSLFPVLLSLFLPMAAEAQDDFPRNWTLELNPPLMVEFGLGPHGPAMGAAKIHAQLSRFGNALEGTAGYMYSDCGLRSGGKMTGTISGSGVSLRWNNKEAIYNLSGTMTGSTISGTFTGPSSGVFKLISEGGAAGSTKKSIDSMTKMQSVGLPWDERLSSPLASSLYDSYVNRIVQYQKLYGRAAEKTSLAISDLAHALSVERSDASEKLHEARMKTWIALYRELCHRLLTSGDGELLLVTYHRYTKHLKDYHLPADEQLREYLSDNLSAARFRIFSHSEAREMAMEQDGSNAVIAPQITLDGRKAWLLRKNSTTATVRLETGEVKPVSLKSIKASLYTYNFHEGDPVKVRDGNNWQDGEIAFCMNGKYFVWIPYSGTSWSVWVSSERLQSRQGRR